MIEFRTNGSVTTRIELVEASFEGQTYLAVRDSMGSIVSYSGCDGENVISVAPSLALAGMPTTTTGFTRTVALQAPFTQGTTWTPSPAASTTVQGQTISTSTEARISGVGRSVQSFGTRYNDAIEVTETLSTSLVVGTDTLSGGEFLVRRYFVAGEGIVRVEGPQGTVEQRIVRQ